MLGLFCASRLGLIWEGAHRKRSSNFCRNFSEQAQCGWIKSYGGAKKGRPAARRGTRRRPYRGADLAASGVGGCRRRGRVWS
jgi:hypothetical protein